MAASSNPYIPKPRPSIHQYKASIFQKQVNDYDNTNDDDNDTCDGPCSSKMFDQISEVPRRNSIKIVDEIAEATDKTSYPQIAKTATVKKKNKKESKLPIFTFRAIFAALVFLLISWYLYTLSRHEDDYEKSLIKIGLNYNIAFEILLQLFSGVTTIKNKNSAGSFLFVYDSAKPDFNMKKFYDFTNEVALTTSKFLRESHRPLVLDGGSLNADSHNHFLRKYKKDLDASGVILLFGVDEIPTNLVMALHYYTLHYATSTTLMFLRALSS